VPFRGGRLGGAPGPSPPPPPPPAPAVAPVGTLSGPWPRVRLGVSGVSKVPSKMIVSVLEAGFLWRVRVLQGPAARHETITSALSALQVRMAGPDCLTEIVMSKAYGLYLGCRRAPIKHRIGSWIQTSHRRRHGVAPNGSVPRYGSAGDSELLAWCPSSPIVRDTKALVGVFRGITLG
jgi:hypothetical protein